MVADIERPLFSKSLDPGFFRKIKTAKLMLSSWVFNTHNLLGMCVFFPLTSVQFSRQIKAPWSRGSGKIKYEPIRKAQIFLYGSNFALLYILIFRLASGKELPFSACTANAEIGVSHEAFFCNMMKFYLLFLFILFYLFSFS